MSKQQDAIFPSLYTRLYLCIQDQYLSGRSADDITQIAKEQKADQANRVQDAKSGANASFGRKWARGKRPHASNTGIE